MAGKSLDRAEGKAVEAECADLGLASWDHYSRPWGIGAVSSCLVSDSGVITAGGQGPRAGEPGRGGGGRAWTLDW